MSKFEEMCKSFADARNIWMGYRDLRVINNRSGTESLPLRSSAVDMQHRDCRQRLSSRYARSSWFRLTEPVVEIGSTH